MDMVVKRAVGRYGHGGETGGWSEMMLKQLPAPRSTWGRMVVIRLVYRKEDVNDIGIRVTE